MKTILVSIVASALACARLAAQAPAAAPPRLLLSKDGAVLLEEGKPARSFASLAELASALPGFRGEVEVATNREPPAPSVAAPPGREAGVSIAAGEVPAVELVKLLADLLGAPVLSEGADQALRERIVFVPKRLDAGDDVLVRRLLEASRFRVLETRLADGRRAVSIEDAQAGFEPAEPRARPIVSVGGGPPAGAGAPGPRAARPPPQEVQRYAGVILEEVPAMLRAQLPLELGGGVLVAAVDEALTARSRTLRQLQRFDVVTHVGTTALSRPAQLVDALNRTAAGAAFELRVLRRGTVKILRGTK